MKNAIEKEYKILLNKEQFDQICSFYDNLIFIKQVNTYYDTKQNDIMKKHGAMRIREKDHVFIFTLKMRQGSDLMEHECEVMKNDVEVFQNEVIQTLLQSYDIPGPFHELTTCTTSRAMIINDDAELCFDINEYSGCIDYELEYEYKRNHDGRTKFNQILQQIGLQYNENCASKIKRAIDACK